MRLNKHQKDIVKKIAKGEITDIISYLKVFELTTFYKLDKDEIEKRMEEEEKGKKYRYISSEFIKRENKELPRFYRDFPLPIISYSFAKEEDDNYIPAIITYNASKEEVDIDNQINFEYDFSQGINVTNSFATIMDFLVVWQFLKTEGLILEVNKEVEKENYEIFYEYKPIEETECGKKLIIKRKQRKEESNKTGKEESIIGSKMYNYKFDPDIYKDYREYIDYLFEYNKNNELICNDFINKKIYGNTQLEIFVKKKFKTSEEINLRKSLVPAYLALILTLGITVWQNCFNSNPEMILMQEQLDVMHQMMSHSENNNLREVENKLQDILNVTDDKGVEDYLKEILKEIKKY